MNPFFRALVACALFVGIGSGSALAAPAASGEVPAAPAVGMAAGMLVDAGSGKVLWSRNADVARPPASLTKVLTALVVLDHVILDENVTVTPEARQVSGSRMYAESGWVMPVRDLLWGLLLQSGNDAAIALAQRVSPDGTVAGFARLMNERAAKLGVKDSTFVNPHGLDDGGHLATARDLAIITAAALRNPTFSEIVGTPTHDIAWGDGTKHTLINHNKLLTRYPGTIGVKTGFTSGAGHSLISAVRRGDNTLIAVALGSPGHYAESARLYNWGFANLPALLANPESTLPQPSAEPPPAAGGVKPSDAGKAVRVGGLDVVQIASPGPSAQRRAPMATVVGLCGAALAGFVLIRRRPRPALGPGVGSGRTGRPPLRLGPELRRSRPY